MIRILLLILAAASVASASSSLKGVVRDPADRLHPDAKVLLLNFEDRKVLYETKVVQGTFRFELVEPGFYRLRIIALGFTPYEDPLVSVAQDEAVDLGDIFLSLGRVYSNPAYHILPLAGRLEYTDPQAKQPAPPTGPRELLFREVGETWPRSVRIGADESFTLRDFPSGPFLVSLSWNGVYVKSIRLGTTETNNGILDLRRRYEGLTLNMLVSSGVGQISGTVRKGNSPAVGARIALVPEDREGSKFPQFTTAGAGGKYSFVGIRPGEYTLAALIDEDSEEAVQAGGLGMYTGFSETVEIHENERLSKDLQQRPRL